MLEPLNDNSTDVYVTINTANEGNTAFCPIIKDNCKESCMFRVELCESLYDGSDYSIGFACSLNPTTQTIIKNLGKPAFISFQDIDKQAFLKYVVGQRC